MKHVLLHAVLVAGIFFPVTSLHAQNTFPASGNAGIGTTTPSTPLTIKTPGTSFGLEHTNGTVSIKTYVNTGIGQTGTYSNHPFQLMANNGINQFVLLPNGNTGIGTAAPAAKLDVRGDASMNGVTIGRGGGNVDFNTAVGYRALVSNQLGDNSNGAYNTAVGYNALTTNTSGFGNTAIGFQSLFYNASGYQNTSMGDASLQSNTTGFANTALGYVGMYSNTSGYQNTAVGDYALTANTTGNGNTAQGYFALQTNTTGNNNTALGWVADVSSGNLTNAMALGYAAKVNASNKVVVGNSSVSVIGGQVGWSTLSDGRFKKDIQANVPGLAFINRLKPVTYHVELEKFERFLGTKDSLLQAGKALMSREEQKLRTGFVAQDVERVANTIHYDFDGVNHPQNEKDNYSLVYSAFVPSLVKAMQELSQQNDSLVTAAQHQQQQLDALFAEVESLKASMGKTGSFAPPAQPALRTNEVSLEQNIPNPSSGSTVIRYTLPSTAMQSQLVISSASGVVIKQVRLTGNGAGNLTINTDGMTAGSYRYSLYVNGSLAASRQMVIAK